MANPTISFGFFCSPSSPLPPIQVGACPIRSMTASHAVPGFSVSEIRFGVGRQSGLSTGLCFTSLRPSHLTARVFVTSMET